MRKTGSQIEHDLYLAIKESEIAQAINGKVYKSETRPIDSKSEDAVISFLTGLDGQVQAGVLNLNIYVPDINNGTGTLVKNTTRCREIEIVANTFIQAMTPGEYRFKIDNIVQTFNAEGTGQHFVNARVKFQLVTF